MAIQLYLVYTRNRKHRNEIYHPKTYSKRFFITDKAEIIHISFPHSTPEKCPKCKENEKLCQIIYKYRSIQKIGKKLYIDRRFKSFCIPKDAYNIYISTKKE